jgi:endonuclease/exonuclease/phosphatase family metal-dependent hydrolase
MVVLRLLPHRSRRVVPVLAAAVLLGLPSGAGATRAMTWNIAGGPNNARAEAKLPFELRSVEAVIARNAPDVVGLQEVCSWQAAALGADLGYSVWHEAAIVGFTDPRDGSGGTCDYGNALLARPPLTLDERVAAPLVDPAACKSDARQGRAPECRVWQSAVLNPGTVRVANTHVGVDATQRDQLTRVVANATAMAPPAVLLGDDNVQPQVADLAPRLAATGYLDAGGALPGLLCADVVGCGQSFPSGGAFGPPKLRADYVWHRGTRAHVGRGSGRVDITVDGVPASDHLALLGDLRPLRPAAPAAGLTIRSRALRHLRQFGLPVTVGVDGTPGTTVVAVTLTASPATTRRLRLRRPLLAQAAAEGATPGAIRLTLRPDRRFARALRRARTARLAVAVTLTAADGSRTRLPTRTIVFR